MRHARLVHPDHLSDLRHGGVFPPQPLVVEEQGALPVEQVEVVHRHLCKYPPGQLQAGLLG